MLTRWWSATSTLDGAFALETRLRPDSRLLRVAGAALRAGKNYTDVSSPTGSGDDRSRNAAANDVALRGRSLKLTSAGSGGR